MNSEAVRADGRVLSCDQDAGQHRMSVANATFVSSAPLSFVEDGQVRFCCPQ